MYSRTSTTLALATALTLAIGLSACGPKKTPAPPPVVEAPAPAPAQVVVPPPAPDTSMDKKPGPLDGDVLAAYEYAVKMGLLGDIYFDFDKFDLRGDARDRLQKNAEFMKDFPQFTFGLEGHCDERGTNEYNLALGEKRANAAKDYLVSLGVDAGRVRTISYGEEKPFCTSHNEACWQENRRGHFVMTGKTNAG